MWRRPAGWVLSHLQSTLKASFSGQEAPALAERRGPCALWWNRFASRLTGSSGCACSYDFCFAILSSSQEILFPPLPAPFSGLCAGWPHSCCRLPSYAWLLWPWPALRDEVKTLFSVKQWLLELCSNWSGFACTKPLAMLWGHF